jgi:hypothetical protein
VCRISPAHLLIAAFVLLAVRTGVVVSGVCSGRTGAATRVLRVLVVLLPEGLLGCGASDVLAILVLPAAVLVGVAGVRLISLAVLIGHGYPIKMVTD